MTDPLEGVTDAHIQAALDALGFTSITVSMIRRKPHCYDPRMLAHARIIAANEKLTAELAELRAKYEPAPVDPVKAEVVEICRMRGIISNGDWAEMIEIGLRRGMEMQPAPFTLLDAIAIAGKLRSRH
jgi:hypothetical protein